MCEKKFRNSMEFSRRDFAINAGRLAGAAAIAPWTQASPVFALLDKKSEKSTPHYFIHIQLTGGLDNRYFFDARPREFTDREMIVHHHHKEPVVYVGNNGQSLLRSTLTDPLMKWASHFSVINGVIMAPDFDVHEQGTNLLLTGNVFGGDFYLPMTNRGNRVLDYLQSAIMYADFRNTYGSMMLTPRQCKYLSGRVGGVSGNALVKSINRQASAVAGHNTSLGHASRLMQSSISAVADFSRRMGQIQIADISTDGASDLDRAKLEMRANLQMFGEFTKNGISDAALIPLQGFNLDTHGADGARGMPAAAQAIAESLAIVFETLHSMPSKDGRSMLDDTTIVVGTEFSRTMRQMSGPFTAMGTDHNALNNTVLLGGKGVKGGTVFGASDFIQPDESLSAVHLKLDAQKNKAMGRPFDPKTGRVLDTSPEIYDPTRYLTAMHVHNTIQAIAGIPKVKRVLYGRGLPPAPEIETVIAG